MKLATKVFYVEFLFSVQSVTFLYYGFAVVKTGGAYADYMDSFIYAVASAFLVYIVHSARNRKAYWFVLVFSGLTLVRSALEASVIYFNASSLPQGVAAVWILVIVVLYLSPVLLLGDKDVRALFKA